MTTSAEIATRVAIYAPPVGSGAFDDVAGPAELRRSQRACDSEPDDSFVAASFRHAVWVCHSRLQPLLMLANPIWGFWMDRVGLWVTTLVAVAIWSVASGSHGLMMDFAGMCFARGVLGFGEGATFPAGLKTVTETLPAEKRSFGLGIAYSGARSGGGIDSSAHYSCCAEVGLARCLRRNGRAEPAVDCVVGGAAPFRLVCSTGFNCGFGCAQKTGTSRWSRNLFAAAAAYGLGAAPLGLRSLPLRRSILTRVLHLSQVSLGHLLWLPPAGWEAGYLFFGRLADIRRRNDLQRGHSPRRPGSVFALLSVAGFLIMLAPMAARSSAPVATTMILFFLQMFIAGGFVVFPLADGMSVLPQAHSAFLAGFAISAWA